MNEARARGGDLRWRDDRGYRGEGRGGGTGRRGDEVTVVGKI